MFRKILVPVDRSALAPRELQTAITLGSRFDAEVVVLRVLGQAASLEAGETEIDLNVVEQETQELLAEAVREIDGASGVRVTAEVRSGPVLDTILVAAQDHLVDLIVVGSHGRRRAIDWLRGSTAEQLVDRASPSVLVIKPEGYPFLTE